MSNLKNLRVFTSLYFGSSLERNRYKLDPKFKKFVFIRYKNGTKGYIVLDIKMREMLISRDVIFHKKRSSLIREGKILRLMLLKNKISLTYS